MSVHVCKCEHNGRTEYHIRYPGLTQQDAQTLADNINSGQLVGADHPLRKDAQRYRWLRDHATVGTVHLQTPDGWSHYGSGADEAVDDAMATAPAVGAA